ncbi:secretogranin-2-like [Megalops cyprinoides]|uniref:secretogranin-2-like n=1 Tax=Megalops cyprinoides TaxID=118141 RepID=UPI0018655EC7|nr:secretogranin-2-like [Megalops cyprinoides]
MLSLPQLAVAGAALLLITLFHARGSQGASVRQHRLRGDEAEGRAASPFYAPSYDMVKALEYIESLRQQTGEEEEPAQDYDDVERFRSLSRLAQLRNQNQGRGEAAAEWQDQKAQQWLMALLRTLQQQEGSEPKEAPSLPNSRYAQKNRQYVEEEDSPADEISDYGGNPKPHKKYPLMFEDETSQESQHKRANEHAEEQYTPQSLATLQTVFEELGKLSASKNQKRDNPDEESNFYRGDDDDMYNVRSLAYEDVTGGEDWTPMEEVETEEEVKDSREESDRGLDDYNTKRSSPPMYGDKEDPDDINKLVDYYLLKILEKTERTEEKREREEEQKAKKRLARVSYSVDPLAFYQLIEISRKLQIPPEDLIEMLKNGEIEKQDRMPEAEVEAEGAEELDQDEVELPRIASYNRGSSPASKFSGRRLPDRLANNIPDEINTEDILNILGLGSLSNQNANYLLKQGQPKITPSRYSPVTSGRRGNYILSEPKVSSKRQEDYDNTVDEDELATFLAAKMLSQYPDVMNKVDQRRSSLAGGSLSYETPEQVIKDYIDQLDSEKSSATKRQLVTEEADNTNTTQTQRVDDVTLPEMTTLQKPEAEKKEEKEPNSIAVGGM